MSERKETIGPRGTAPGFRPLIGSEQWHRNDFEPEMLQGGWRPLLDAESSQPEDEVFRFDTWGRINYSLTPEFLAWPCRTRRPLPPFPPPPAGAIPSTGSNASSDCTYQRLKRVYDGWFDDMPESVEECIADVKRVLYPTDADRCEAALERWRIEKFGVSAVLEFSAKEAWKAAWQAAKQDKQ